MLSISFLEFQRGGSAPTVDDSTSISRCCPGWDEELEVHDSGAQDTLEVALDLEPGCGLWLPLRAVASHADNSFDAIKLAVTYYSEDCVAQGYVFSLFCGLLPLSVIEDFHDLMWQFTGTNKNTGRIHQSNEEPSATEEKAPSTHPKITAPIQSSSSRETPLAIEAEHLPIPPQNTAS